jgi:hypothetical protein
MISKKKVVLINFLILLLAVGCAHKPTQVTEANKKEAEARYVDNSVANETDSSSYVEIGFKEGSATLTDSAKLSLNSIIKETRPETKIDEVIVLSWSDQEYPSKNLNQLPKEQRELAEKRNNNVEQYVKMMRDVQVNTYNMAERPTAFSKIFNTADSKLKNSLLSAGLSTSADSGDYANKASRSVILLKLR